MSKKYQKNPISPLKEYSPSSITLKVTTPNHNCTNYETLTLTPLNTRAYDGESEGGNKPMEAWYIIGGIVVVLLIFHAINVSGKR